MDQLDPPDETIWQERRDWFETRQAAHAAGGAPAPSEQTCALMIDLQAVFCAGAWAAAVILAAAIVESQAREKGAWRRAESAQPRDKSAVWLHRLRNRLLHEDKARPVLTVEAQWFQRGQWEDQAKRAVDLAFAALYDRTNPQDEATT
ncbi:MAG TPA: hypothetical protein VKN76_14680 [Kiloniellaceae bacterium]|nr:hypothetical protein [Kiloniellaceae bacterium]